MDIVQMLHELAEGWRLTLKSTDDGWRLTVATERPDQRWSCFEYEGTDLRRVVSAAWAGEPSGRK